MKFNIKRNTPQKPLWEQIASANNITLWYVDHETFRGLALSDNEITALFVFEHTREILRATERLHRANAKLDKLNNSCPETEEWYHARLDATRKKDYLDYLHTIDFS